MTTHCIVPGCSRPIHVVKRGWCSAHYDRWRKRGDVNWVLRRAPNGAGHITWEGYRLITFNGRTVKEHRVVWEQHHGTIPKGFHIHHKNHDKLDNRIENLELMHHSDHLKYHHAIRRKPCTISGCTNNGRSIGLCPYHYNKHRRTRQDGPPCKNNCKRPAIAKGECCVCYGTRKRRERRERIRATGL